MILLRYLIVPAFPDLTSGVWELKQTKIIEFYKIFQNQIFSFNCYFGLPKSQLFFIEKLNSW